MSSPKVPTTDNGVLGSLTNLLKGDAMGSLTGMFYIFNILQIPKVQLWLEQRPKLLWFVGAILTFHWQWEKAVTLGGTAMKTVRTWLSADYVCHGTDEGFKALYEHIRHHFKPRNISTSYTVRSYFENKQRTIQLSGAPEPGAGNEEHFKTHSFVCEQQPEWELFLYKRWQPIFLKIKANDSEGGGEISMFGPRCTSAVKEILEQVSKVQSISRNDETTTYRAHGNTWIGGTPKPQRSMATVEIPAAEKRRLLKNVDFFVANTRDEFYAKHGQPYRTGYLFYGPPGTGKTSCVMAIAGRTKRNIFKIPLLDSRIDDNILMDLLNIIPEPSIILFEDIDSAGIGREFRVFEEEESEDQSKTADRDGCEDCDEEAEEQGSRVSYSGLLNALDGTDAPEGHIVIMTTNCREMLDDALIRDGRINIQLYFGYATQETARDMYIRIMGDSVDAFLPAEVQDDNVRMIEKVDAQKLLLNSTKTSSKESQQNEVAYLTQAFDIGDVDSGAPTLTRSSSTDNRSPNSTMDSRHPGLQDLAFQFASQIPTDIFTPAQLQVYLFIYIDDPQGAVDGLEEWKARKIAEHKQREAEKILGAEKREAKLEADRQRAIVLKEMRMQKAALEQAQLQAQLQLANSAALAAVTQKVSQKKQGQKQSGKGRGGGDHGGGRGRGAPAPEVAGCGW